MRIRLVLALLLGLLISPVVALPAQAQLVDINSATAAALDTLPGVGEVRSKAIVAGRPYAEKTDLVSKKVLSQGVFDGLKDKIALANINTTTAKDMAKVLPGIGEVRSAAIVTGRPYAKPEDLVSKKVLTQAQYDAIRTLITTK